MICLALILILFICNFLPLKKKVVMFCALVLIISLAVVSYLGYVKQNSLYSNYYLASSLGFVLLYVMNEFLTTNKEINILSPIPILLFIGILEVDAISLELNLTMSVFLFLMILPRQIRKKYSILALPLFGFLSLTMVFNKLAGSSSSVVVASDYSNQMLPRINSNLISYFYLYSIGVFSLNYIRSNKCLFSLNIIILLSIYFSYLSVSPLFSSIVFFGICTYLVISRSRRSLYSVLPLLIIFIFQLESKFSFILFGCAAVQVLYSRLQPYLAKVIDGINLQFIGMSACLISCYFFPEVHLRVYLLTITFISFILGVKKKVGEAQ